MKKFQKALSTGLILAQVCSSSLVLGTANDSDEKPEVSVRVVSENSSGILGTVNKWFARIVCGLLLGGASWQVACAKCPGIALASAKYADTDNFKFSDYVKPSASLRLLNQALAMGGLELDYLDTELICQEITGGWKQAAKIAALGFAKDIYVKRNGGTEFKFYYIPGDYGLTSVDACTYLQHLIEKANNINTTQVEQKTKFLNKLKQRKEFLKGCVSYEAWVKATTAMKTVKETLPFSGNIKNKQNDTDDAQPEPTAPTSRV